MTETGGTEPLAPGSSDGKPIRVVVMVDSIERPGGAETLAIEGAARLDPARFERWFCITRWEPRFEEQEPSRSLLRYLRESGVQVVGLERPGRFALWSWAPLIRLLRRERIDVLHGHLFGSNVWAVLLGRLTRVPVIVAHEHMWAYSGNRMRPLIDRDLIARFSDAFIAVSEEGRRRMIEIERIPEREVVYVPNGIPELPPGEGAGVRAGLGIPADAPLVGSVGHLRVEKAYEVVIAALADLPGAHLLIAGEGPERPKLERLRAELGLEDRVHLPGARDDIPDVLAALDVAVCCSDFEGGPLSVMEYMGAGLPVVGTRVGGLPEMIRDGETGLLVEPRDPPALAAAVAGLLSDPERAARLGTAGRALRSAEYDVSVWVRRLEGLYTRLLAPSRLAGRRRPGSGGA